MARPDTRRTRLGPRAEPRGGAPADGRDRQQRSRGSDRVGEGQGDGFSADAMVGCEHGDRRQHRPGAGDEDEPEARAEQEAAAQVARGAPREPLERPGREIADLRHEQGHGDDEEQGDGDVPQQVLRQPEQIEQPRGAEREQREAGDETGDDPERPAAACPTGEHDRQDGKDARRSAVTSPATKPTPSRTTIAVTVEPEFLQPGYAVSSPAGVRPRRQAAIAGVSVRPRPGARSTVQPTTNNADVASTTQPCRDQRRKRESIIGSRL